MTDIDVEKTQAIMKARKNAAYVAENRLAEEMHEAVDRATVTAVRRRPSLPNMIFYIPKI